eukprot:4830836-Prymnesium_polylepis.1
MTETAHCTCSQAYERQKKRTAAYAEAAEHLKKSRDVRFLGSGHPLPCAEFVVALGGAFLISRLVGGPSSSG